MDINIDIYTIMGHKGTFEEAVYYIVRFCFLIIFFAKGVCH